MKNQTSRVSLGSQVHTLVAQVAKTKHGKSFQTIFEALHNSQHCRWPIVAVQSVAKKVNERGYKRYLEDHIELKDGKKIHVCNQFTHGTFKLFVKHVKNLK